MPVHVQPNSWAGRSAHPASARSSVNKSSQVVEVRLPLHRILIQILRLAKASSEASNDMTIRDAALRGLVL